ncbi:fibronectin type III-like domain-contianing protein [Amycolatopsis sp. NPDC006125]|uniref:fibronectin type III-like domain-contianing protein n=1 Tax=Amycolatopsis sp. NPDC006125 TaxID=3156730 RepID=UPI0033BD684D
MVQVYVRAPGEVDARLAGFAGVWLEPGETAGVVVALGERVWQRWCGGGWVVPPGGHEVLVGRSVEEITQTLTREW